MKVNPFYLLLVLYVISNFWAVIKGSVDGGLMLEGEFFKINPSSLFVAFLIQCSILLLFYICYKILYRTSIKKVPIELNDRSGCFLLFLQVAFMAFNVHEGINIAGAGTTIEGGSVLNYLFVILQPDLIFTIVSILLVSNKLFFLNVIVFFVSMFLRGWMGGVFIVFFLVLVRFYPVRLSTRSALTILFSFIILMALMPYIIYAKWSMRSGDGLLDFYLMLPNILDLIDYNSTIDYLLNRFQHVGHVAIIYEDSSNVFNFYQLGKFDSFWLDGLPQYIFMKLFGLDFYRLNSFMVEYFFGVSNPTWNTNPGLAGWFAFLQEKIIYVFLYLIFCFLLPLYFIAKFGGAKLLLLFSCFAVLYLFHGWFGAYFNFMIYCVFIVFILTSKLQNSK
ncbi:oligosaccharide repeat unit polymerase [Aeromonas hydrophila]|uniref:Oligosaccharide repeat unit polymerase n=1 Tax=Aeromonas hydrophila TaxID=644 RepID=A0AAD3U834_AERHY|nr:oligosaccharide repeat unit polymerase [Aeromonas hydrophila]